MNNLNRILVGSVASLLATASAFAIPKAPCEKTPDVCCEEAKPGPFAFAYPKDINLSCPADFYVHGAFLIMQAKEDGMDFALRNSNGAVLPITQGETLGFTHDNSDYGYNPGVRFGLGFYLHHDAWSIDFDWTWLNISQRTSYSANNGGILLPLWAMPFSPATGGTSWTHVAGVWHSHYNTLDARLGKPYHVSRDFILKPHFGIRAGWIDQHFGVNYQGVFNAQSGMVASGDNDFWGVGARCGLESEWIVGKGWQLFGNVAGSMLFGKFDITQSLPFGAGSANIGYDLENKFYQNVPNMEMQLGIAWNKYFNKDKYRIGIAAAYEFHEWFDQFNMKKFYGTVTPSTPTTAYELQSDTSSRGNLTLNGFSVKLQLDI